MNAIYHKYFFLRYFVYEKHAAKRVCSAHSFNPVQIYCVGYLQTYKREAGFPLFARASQGFWGTREHNHFISREQGNITILFQENITILFQGNVTILFQGNKGT